MAHACSTHWSAERSLAEIPLSLHRSTLNPLKRYMRIGNAMQALESNLLLQYRQLRHTYRFGFSSGKWFLLDSRAELNVITEQVWRWWFRCSLLLFPNFTCRLTVSTPIRSPKRDDSQLTARLFIISLRFRRIGIRRNLITRWDPESLPTVTLFYSFDRLSAQFTQLCLSLLYCNITWNKKKNCM